MMEWSGGGVVGDMRGQQRPSGAASGGVALMSVKRQLSSGQPRSVQLGGGDWGRRNEETYIMLMGPLIHQ